MKINVLITFRLVDFFHIFIPVGSIRLSKYTWRQVATAYRDVKNMTFEEFSFLIFTP